MGMIFCVEFQRVPLKFHIKYVTHTLKDVDLFTGENLRALRFKSSSVFLKCPPGPCITIAMWCYHKQLSQWQRNFRSKAALQLVKRLAIIVIWAPVYTSLSIIINMTCFTHWVLFSGKWSLIAIPYLLWLITLYSELSWPGDINPVSVLLAAAQAYVHV